MNVFFYIYILPVIIGLLLGISLWKFKRTYIICGILIVAGIVWWCILRNINTHGSEGPGILAWIYSVVATSFSIVEIIKFMVRKIITGRKK